MTIPVFRLGKLNHRNELFSGIGGLYTYGRWTSRGLRVVYTSASLSLALLEYTVHYKNRGWVPATVLGRAEIPDALEIEALDPNSLREDWAEPAAPNELQEIGKRWIQAGATAVLKVPSATVQSEWNYLLNPRHPDFRRIQVNQPEVYILDSRLARARRK